MLFAYLVPLLILFMLLIVGGRIKRYKTQGIAPGEGIMLARSITRIGLAVTFVLAPLLQTAWAQTAADATDASKIDWGQVKDFLEALSFVVTIITLPFAVLVWARDQRKDLDNDEEEQYQHLSDAYNAFLQVVLSNADLQLRTARALENPTAEQQERMLIIFDMLISLFERAYLVAHKPEMTAEEQRRWNSWDDYMREWIRRDDFHNVLPQLLRGEDPEFQGYVNRLVSEERTPA